MVFGQPQRVEELDDVVLLECFQGTAHSSEIDDGS